MPLFAQRCWEFSKLPIGKCLDAFQLGDQHVRVADDVGRQIAREGVEDLGRYPIGEPEQLVERMRMRIEIVTDDDVSPGTAGGGCAVPARRPTHSPPGYRPPPCPRCCACSEGGLAA